MKIYFDIETIPLQNQRMKDELLAEHMAELPELLAAVKAPGNYKDLAKIEEYITTERAKIEAGHGAAFEEWHLKTSFDGGLGQICCIGMAIDDGASSASGVESNSPADEAKVLTEFFDRIRDAYGSGARLIFVGHNSNAFDIPFIWKRAIVLGIQPPLCFPRDPKPWDASTFDTMIAWNGPSSRAGGPMDRICKVLGIPGKSGMDGSQVWPAFQAGRILDIAKYCAEDVDRTRAMYKRMTFSA